MKNNILEGKHHVQFIHSIQARLLFVVVMVTIIPILILQAYSLLSSYDQLHKDIYNQFTILSENETEYITSWANERMFDVRTIAMMKDIQAPNDSTINILKDNKNLLGTYEAFGLAGMDGMVNYSSEGNKFDIHERQYFIDGITGKDVVSEPIISKVTGNVIVIFAVPVKESDKQAGLLLGNVPVTTIKDILSRLDLGETGEAYIITKNGLLVTPSKYEALLKTQGKIKDTSALNYKVETYASQQIMLGQTGISEYTSYLGKDVIGAYTWIPELNWGLIIEQEKSEAFASIYQMLFISLGVNILVVLAIIFIIFFVTRSIARPIKTMSMVADELAEGKIDQTVTHVGKDEMGLLAHSFRKIIEYQKHMANTANQISDGNLLVEVIPLSSEDVFGNAFVKMISRLKDTIGGITENAKMLETSSQNLASAAIQSGHATNQIATTIQQISMGAQKEVESISQTASSVDQMSRAIDGVAKGAQDQSMAVNKVAEITNQITNAIRQVTSNAEAGAQGSEKAAQVANGGAKTVKATISGMETIREKVSLSSQKVEEMGNRSIQIGAIIEAIEDIASQTNLLALNAAIEAARAGEHGKGFAVVADEVRKLAEKSATATKEIGELIKGIQVTVTDAVSAMQEGSVEVEKGVDQANQAGEALDQILKAAEDVNRQVSEIASAAQQMSILSNELISATDSVSAVVEENTAATEEMSAGSGEVAQLIENITSVSEENSAAVEEVSASAEEMSAQVEQVSNFAQSLAAMSDNLQKLVSKFTVK